MPFNSWQAYILVSEGGGGIGHWHLWSQMIILETKEKVYWEIPSIQEWTNDTKSDMKVNNKNEAAKEIKKKKKNLLCL